MALVPAGPTIRLTVDGTSAVSLPAPRPLTDRALGITY